LFFFFFPPFSQVSDALRDADERVHTLTVQHSAAMNANKDEIRSLQDRLVEFCESAVANHQVMQTQVDRLRVLCGHVQGDCDFLRHATDSTRSRVTSVQEALEQPIVNFSNECKHRVSRLSEEIQKCQSELEDAKDQVSIFFLCLPVIVCVFFVCFCLVYFF
jgi:chromosome segregation ATPase